MNLIPKIVEAARFNVVHRSRHRDLEGATTPGVVHRYAAVYEIEPENLDSVVGDMNRLGNEGRLQMSPSLDVSKTPPMMLLLVPHDE